MLQHGLESDVEEEPLTERPAEINIWKPRKSPRKIDTDKYAAMNRRLLINCGTEKATGRELVVDRRKCTTTN